MEVRTLNKNGRTVEYFIDEENFVIVRDTETKNILRKAPVNPDDSKIDTQGYSEFTTCMRGCYNLGSGSNWELAACIAECSTLLPT